MQATCFGSLELSSGLYLYFNTDPNFFPFTIGILKGHAAGGAVG